jgi:putative two-component system response regulator
LEPLKAFYPELAAGVLSHHERWDGSGYPRGLKGTRIPLEARIVAIADTFDAVSHSRRYRRGQGIENALRIIREGRGTQFDPQLVDLVILPPVVERLTRERLASGRPRSGRRTRAQERAPDVSFRWRSESLGARGLRAAHHVD